VGWNFWLKLLGGVIAVGIAVGIVFLFIGAAFVAWGALGAIVFFAGLVLLVAWFYDRRHQASWDDG
jgi:uncharacterized membrane protein HdeD (DUF308 family)